MKSMREENEKTKTELKESYEVELLKMRKSMIDLQAYCDRVAGELESERNNNSALKVSVHIRTRQR